MNDIDDLLRTSGARLRADAPTPADTEAALRTLGDVTVRPVALRSRRPWIIGPALLAAAAAVVAVVVMARDPRRDVTPIDTATAPSPTTGSTVDSTRPPTTSTPPSTPPSAPIVWTPAAAYPSGYGMGCCGANATGTPSPPLPSPGEPLAAGTYWMDIVGWSADAPATLRVSVRSFVACADGVAECSPDIDGSYGSDEVGLSTQERLIDVTLDGSVTVYLAGDDLSAPIDDGLDSELATTDGTGLADLMTAIADAYEAAIGTPLRDGGNLDDIVTDLQATPRLGFSSAADRQTGVLYFRHGDAPSVLFQSVAVEGEPLERSGTSALIPRTFTVSADGAITLEIYAGFRS